jgi:hypothetical protein
LGILISLDIKKESVLNFFHARQEHTLQRTRLFLTLILLALALFFSMSGKVSALKPETANMVPVSVGESTSTPTSSNSPTPIPTDGPTGGPPLSLTLTLLFTCCALGLVVGVLALGFILSMQKQKAEKQEKGS